MYESPVKIIAENVQMQLEDNVVSTIQKLGIDINKEELIKALDYDRQQYIKGYADGKHDAQFQWIPCSERLPSKADHKDNMVLVCYGNGSVRFNTYMNGWVQGNPVAWMPLPEPWKGEQS